MSKSNLHEQGYLKLVYQNIAHANIGNAGGLQPSSAAGSLYIALFTTNPGESDAGAEGGYTGYARIAVVRSAAGWTVALAGDNSTCKNAAAVTFPISTGGGTPTITYFGIYTAITGGDLIASGTIGSPPTIQIGDTPKFNASQIIVAED